MPKAPIRLLMGNRRYNCWRPFTHCINHSFTNNNYWSIYIIIIIITIIVISFTNDQGSNANANESHELFSSSLPPPSPPSLTIFTQISNQFKLWYLEKNVQNFYIYFHSGVMHPISNGRIQKGEWHASWWSIVYIFGPHAPAWSNLLGDQLTNWWCPVCFDSRMCA